eukprot:scaffold51986_cov77-Phaeocystis_antarctica.AAC.2
MLSSILCAAGPSTAPASSRYIIYASPSSSFSTAMISSVDICGWTRCLSRRRLTISSELTLKSSTSTLRTSDLRASSSMRSVPGSPSGDEFGCATLVPIGAAASISEVPPEFVAAEVPPLAVDSCTPQ